MWQLLQTEKTVESPLDSKKIKLVTPKGNQSWIFIDELMLKLKLQYFGHLMWRTDSLKKALMLGKSEGRRRRDNRGWDGWMASPTQWIWVWANSGRWWRTGKPVKVLAQHFSHSKHFFKLSFLFSLATEVQATMGLVKQWSEFGYILRSPCFLTAPGPITELPRTQPFLSRLKPKSGSAPSVLLGQSSYFHWSIVTFGVSETWVQMQTLPLISCVTWHKTRAAITKHYRLGDICFSCFWRLGSPRSR